MYVHTYIHTYIHMNVITSARGKVILIYRDVKTCTVVCDKVCTYIAGSSICTSCDAGKFSAAVGATSIDTCSNCNAGKFSAAVGATSVASKHVCVFFYIANGSGISQRETIWRSGLWHCM
jgi:hypothetical protein